MDFWNSRYAHPDYAYGTAPNVFFAEQLTVHRPSGSMLLPADGEGRNGVYAAEQGMDVYAFDLSVEGQKKALRLAEDRGVTIDYRVGDFRKLGYRENRFDVLALIFAHFPAAEKEAFNRTLASYLKPGGLLLFEAFGSQHLAYREADPKVGGPGVADMLFSTEELQRTFPNYRIELLEERPVQLAEGPFHQGTGSVVRMIARKPLR